MQPYQYALAAGVALLITLTVLPWLFAIAKRRAFDLGKEIGLNTRDADHAQQIRTLKGELEDIAIHREAEQRKHHTANADLQGKNLALEHRINARNAQLREATDAQAKSDQTIANLKLTITELEERIMSYTGLAVTRADYDLVLKATDTLQLSQRTLKALKSQTQADIAGAQAEALSGLAKRIHAQLRSTAATSARTEEAA
ncbi:hypothetical protein ACLNBI_07220 [Pseudomonas guariconensis]|uniref:hypothetical protein n=1 Tax=Pseudomonas guariconensis TaxID=1288410 RepID=UPI0039EBB310